MKPHFIFAFIFLAISSWGKAQTITTASIQGQPAGLYQLLPAYLAVKDALVNSSAEMANKKASDLQKVISSIYLIALPAADKATFARLKEKLVFDARHISESKELDHQRDHFKTLSANMAMLAKTVKLADTPVYQDYCPMKKAVWLSNEAAIKNPYYGNQMLTCGTVTETIK